MEYNPLLKLYTKTDNLRSHKQTTAEVGNYENLKFGKKNEKKINCREVSSHKRYYIKLSQIYEQSNFPTFIDVQGGHEKLYFSLFFSAVLKLFFIANVIEERKFFGE